jgi:hypothetical protein
MTKQKFPYLLFSLGIVFFYAILWLSNDFIASFLSLVIPSIAIAIGIISYIAERLEKSDLPSWYFPVIALLIFLPLITALVFGYIFEFNFQWQQN